MERGKCIERQYDTRNHRFALQQLHVHYDMHRFSFSNRIIPLWNSLPDYEVSTVSSPTTNIFKARLDKFWIIKVYDTIVLITYAGKKNLKASFYNAAKKSIINFKLTI